MTHKSPTPPQKKFRWHIRAMLKIGIFGFGGGSALIPMMEKELVGTNKLTELEFVQDTVIANITPGALPVKLAALSGSRLGGAKLAAAGAFSVAFPGALMTVGLLAIFSQLGPAAITSIEYASLGITAFILYLIGHYVVKVLHHSGRSRWLPIVIAVLAFLATGADRTIDLVQMMIGTNFLVTVPELSALGLVLVALIVISIHSLWQYIRRIFHIEEEPLTTRAGQTRRSMGATALFTCFVGGVFLLAFAYSHPQEFFLFHGLVFLSTVTSFGGGEAYVGVADSFFVAPGLADSAIFYGQIVPLANALPGPILIKIASALAYLVSGDEGWVMAGAAFLISVAACSALATAVLAGYNRARNSLLIKNISTFILPVICGLLASTGMSMLMANAEIGLKAGISPAIAVIGSVVLAILVPVLRRVIRVPDILFILAYGTLSFLALSTTANF